MCAGGARRACDEGGGYEDRNEHDERHRSAAPASPSTLNRPGQPWHRHKWVVARPEAFNDLLVDLFLESRAKAPREFRLDLDATDDQLHGAREGCFFHGYCSPRSTLHFATRSIGSIGVARSR